MTKTLVKNTFREIAHTKARFFSIMAIIALGVGFFAGIKATAPSMYHLAEHYYRQKELMDFRLVSTVGFAEEDIDAVAKLDGVQSVMPSYFCDVMTSSADGGDIVRLIAVPKAYKDFRTLNTLTVTEGRSVRRSGEIITESVPFANANHGVGKKITFAPMAGDNALSDLLNTAEFTVVGKAESPLYISYQRGTTNIGDGKIDEYMYISADDFKIPRYTELYVKADFSDQVSAFSDAYRSKSSQMKAALEALAAAREAAFTTEVIPHAEEELAKGKKEYADKKAEAEKKLGDGLKQLEAGEKEYNDRIAEAEKKLRDAKEMIDSGEAALAAGEGEYAAAIASAERMIASGKAQLAAGQAQLDAGRKELEARLAEMDTSDGDAFRQITRDTTDAIGSAQLGVGQAQLFAGSAQLAVGESELAAKRISGQQQLAAARTQLKAAKQQYESGMAELKTKKEEGAEKLREAREAYNDAKAEADKKLADGLTLLNEGEAALQKLKETESTWYVFDRDGNPGYATYGQNADRLDAVASAFPLFFLLVAVLVCVTTMTRLIEEKRTEIATLKALGYGNGAIILKYVLYSLIAAVAGSIVGVWAGVSTLPFIIYDAYRIMFYIGDIDLILHIPSIALGTLAAVCCTTAVSVIVCVKSLRIKPAQGMRPKAPKPGKRILLERVTPLWKHMSFTAKLTARNIFRYKVRMCMTVIGVAGCTALIVAAFGLLNSFDPLTQTQFGEIFRYDTVIIPRKSGTPQELQYLKDLSAETGKVSASMLALQEDVTVSFADKHAAESTYIAVPEDPAHMDSLICLRTRREHTPLALGDDRVLINERLASDLGISVGDTITLETENGTASVEVGGVYEQYIYNYVFMTPACYQRLFRVPPQFNIYEVRLHDQAPETQEAFSAAILRNDRIVAVSFTEQSIKDFRNMLSALDMVIVVMVVCAGALALVVLYNLTNINLAERQREIATFKVLGFFNRETARFIYLENIILTILGIVAGLGLGVLLSDFIIRTVEVDNVMFGRDIHAWSFACAAGMTFLFSLMVNAATGIKIKAVNMVESLKSID